MITPGSLVKVRQTIVITPGSLVKIRQTIVITPGSLVKVRQTISDNTWESSQDKMNYSHNTWESSQGKTNHSDNTWESCQEKTNHSDNTRESSQGKTNCRRPHPTPLQDRWVSDTPLPHHPSWSVLSRNVNERLSCSRTGTRSSGSGSAWSASKCSLFSGDNKTEVRQSASNLSRCPRVLALKHQSSVKFI